MHPPVAPGKSVFDKVAVLVVRVAVISSLLGESLGQRGAAPASAATQTILYRFAGGTDGFSPLGTLIVDSHGALYGTTQGGGTGSLGTVFKLSRAGGKFVKTILHDFRGSSDGAAPLAGVLPDAGGALYGTTASGGAGHGTIFKLTPNGSRYTETILYRFKGGADGSLPTGTLVAGHDGALYGTTYNGGSPANAGTVFELTPKSGGGYSERILYRFAGGADGANPVDGDGLLLDAAGDLFGTTENGGVQGGLGTVFELQPGAKGYTKRELWSFAGSDGGAPLASVISDGNGGLIGTTKLGGAANVGKIFDLQPVGQAYEETVLYGFGAVAGDGALPVARPIRDAGGNLYGTTGLGGTCSVAPLDQCGTVYEFAPGQTVDSILVNFSGGLDGNYPQAGLVFDTHGVLYGTTQYGGGSTACGAGCGTVFAVKP